MMTVGEILKYLERWAPPGAAWKNDNVGIQVGSADKEVTKILLALDLNKLVLNEAIEKNCNLIITHHPLIFKPIHKLETSKDPKSQLIKELILNDISVISAHTNLDFTKEGVSWELAKVLGLTNIEFLELQDSNQYKLVVFVPLSSVETVAEAIFEAGGGVIGEYTKCSYRTEGTGTFYGSEDTDPAAGEKGKHEKVDEVRLEVLIDKWNTSRVIKAMTKAHPYEEVAYDLYTLNNKNVNYGMGAIGNLEKALNKDEFLQYVCNKLGADAVRYNEGSGSKILRVAVCGGSGADLVNKAAAEGADAYITGDVKYHSFQDAENKILFIDAGHYETEIHSLNVVKQKLEYLINNKESDIEIEKYSGNTSPIKFYNNKGD